ncbi:hypothetical protein HN415_04790 [Candidatus Woesearchaeota archaeon]|jgi:tRNA uracil 4-sulfurtransferase|nr:hypothetical protein [Candidatus Woesearchaeota archaeon]
MKGVVLLSDGIDSPVAAMLMKKQGLELIFLNFKNDNNPRTIEKVKKIANHIDKNALLITKDHIKTQEKIKNSCNVRYQCVLCKRAMYKGAEEVAIEHGAKFIVTGENLGQVASQTLDNMYVLDSSVNLTVLRPLLGFDKNEIVKRGKELGTYELSLIKAPSCPYVPDSPLTKSRLHKVLIEEKKMNR